MSRRVQARIARAFALVLVGVAVVIAARGLERQTTWYLASDQFAFLTFARDIAHGRVLHPADDLERLAPRPEGHARDVLFQTYFWVGDRVYSRYPPGFPAVLALAGLLGGEPAQRLVNPMLYLALLAVVAWLCWAALRPSDRSLAAGTAVAAVWLLLLLPTQIHLWGSTVARDLLAHLLGLGALVATLYAVPATAGILLGLACTVRPDAALYGVSLVAVLGVQRARARLWLSSALGFAAGVLPLLLYNRVARGSLLGFTQGDELDHLLSSLGGSPLAVLAQSVMMPSGGGLRLSHLRSTLAGNVRLLLHAFSWSALATSVGLAWSLRHRPVLAAALLPYALVALLFFSFWPHPDARYLAGVSVALIVPTALGAVVLCRRLVAQECSTQQRVALAGAAAAVGALAWVVGRRGAPGAGPEIAVVVAIVAVAALSRLGEGRGIERAAVLAPGLALAFAGLLRLGIGEGRRDPFQEPQVERARDAVESVVPPGALVLVGEGLGRPAENIAYYTHADAHYVRELALLSTTAADAATRYARSGRRAFLLVASGDGSAAALEREGRLTLLERRRGAALYEWFVDPRAAPEGARLYEVEPARAAVAPAEPPGRP
jgi:hypothetical protein